jgi:hypothetical protein
MSFFKKISFDIGKYLIAVVIFIDAEVFNDDEFNANQRTYI